MPDRVLVAYDDSEEARAALEYALREFPDAAISVATVTDPTEAAYLTGDEYVIGGNEWHKQATKTAEGYLEEATEIAGDRQIDTVRLTGRPSREIIEYATDNDIDHIVLGSRGRTGLRRVLLGSVAEAVLRRAPVPVTVVR